MDPRDEKASKAPQGRSAEMIINSSELRGAGFRLQELIPPQLQCLAKSRNRRSGAGLKQLQGVGPLKLLLHVDTDNDLRARCE